MARCPVKLHEELLQATGLLDGHALAAMEAEIAAEIDDAVAFAKASPFPPRSELAENLYA